MPRIGAALVVLAPLLAGCSLPTPTPTPGPSSPGVTPPASTTGPGPTPSPAASRSPTPSATTRSTAPPPPSFSGTRVLADIRHLASDIGPREATSRNFDEAADWAERRFRTLGYTVRRTSVPVPAGNSWGTPVRRGTSANVVAEPAGFDRRRPHLVVGAHLDTIPVAPGAEDNASGVAVMLELARLASRQDPRLPVQFVAFGAEEPRGAGDALHHFGSTRLVARMSGARRRARHDRLDRVGVTERTVPVCRGPGGSAALVRALRTAGSRTDVATSGCENTGSDHWSYTKAGMPAARIGGNAYAGYHSRGDVYRVVNRRQLERVGSLAWSWLTRS